MQVLKTGKIAIYNISCDGFSRRAIVGVAGQVAVLNHQHPGFTILDQAQPKGFPQGVPRTQEGGIALAEQEIAQAAPGQFKGGFERLNQSLLLAIIEGGGGGGGSKNVCRRYIYALRPIGGSLTYTIGLCWPQGWELRSTISLGQKDYVTLRGCLHQKCSICIAHFHPGLVRLTKHSLSGMSSFHDTSYNNARGRLSNEKGITSSDGSSVWEGP